MTEDCQDFKAKAWFTQAEVDKGVPKSVPSITELKKALPAHCFKPSLAMSLYFVVKDLAMVLVLYLVMVLMEQQPYVILTLLYMPVYWYLQGTLFAAIFILGHDCGHESFSRYSWINDIIGNLLHTFILVPYYPWKLSHRHHHKNTGNIDKDEVFYPVRDQEQVKGWTLPYFGFGVGWFFYLVKGYNPRSVNHLNPFDPLMVRNSVQCIISLTCLMVWISFGLVPYALAFGLKALLIHYLMPVFGFGCWIVVITFLHHHDDNTPWYADHKWDFVRGQLSSVDRHYGWCHDLLHNIGTHQIHHLFSKIPHYHLEEATKVFRHKYPDLVRISDEPILSGYSRMFQLYNDQVMIPQDTEIHVYSSKRQ